MVAASKKSSSTEIETKWEQFTTEDLKNLQSFEDVEKLLQEHGVVVVSASEELGDGFALIDNKSILEKRPLMFVSWTFSQGDYSEEFVSARVMCHLENGTIGKYVLNDGGTGIRAQLREYTNSHKNVQGGLFANKGLRSSGYDTCKECGKPLPASADECSHCGYDGPERGKSETWYIDTSA